MVTLHRVGSDSSGPIDSVRSDVTGRYAFRFRRFGAPEAVYFAAAVYRGIAYFGAPLTAARSEGEAAEITANKLGLPVYFPSKHLSTDNAAMIAAAGYFHLNYGATADLRMTADITMRLQNVGNEDAELRKKKVRYRL